MADTVVIHDGVVDLAERTVRVGDTTRRLTTNEASLLRYLVERTGRAVSRDELLQAVCGYDDSVTTRAIDLAIYRLRKKIEREPSTPTQIITERYVGYRFIPAERDAMPMVSQSSVPRLGPLFGREEALSVLDSASGQLSLVGAPGIGKTHLVASWAAKQPLVFWVEMSAISTETAAAQAIAEACQVPAASADEPLQTIGFALAGAGEAVLVLDAVDGLGDRLEAMVTGLNRWAPQLLVLTTGRRTPGSQLRTHRLRALEPPAAMALLRSQVDIELGDEVDYLPLFALLQGTPLAIRLAARWIPVLPRGELYAALHERIDLLGAGTTSVDHVVGWAWEQLSAEDREALSRLSAFLGPFSLASAADVLGLAPLQAAETLGRLVHQSMVEARGSPRAFLVVTAVASFAAHRDPATREAAMDGVVRALRREGAVLLKSHPDGRHMERYEVLHGRLADLEAAIAHARERGMPELGGLLIIAMILQRHVRPEPDLRALLDEAVEVGRDPFLLARARLLRAFLLRTSDAPAVEADLVWLEDQAPRAMRAATHRMRALVAMSQGRLEEAEEAIELALAESSTTDPSRVHARARHTAALVAWKRHGPKAGLPHAETLLASIDPTADPTLLCELHGLLGHLEAASGQYEVSRVHFQSAVDLGRRLDLRGPVAGFLYNLGNCTSRLGELEAAVTRYEEAHRAYLRLGPRSGGVASGMAAANTLFYLGRMDEAEAAVDRLEALPWIERFPRPRATGWTVRGQVAYSRGDFGRAARFMSSAAAQWEPHGVIARLIAVCALADHGDAAEARRVLAPAESRLQDRADPARRIVLLCARAHCALAEGDPVSAQALLGEVDAMLGGKVGSSSGPVLEDVNVSGFALWNRWTVSPWQLQVCRRRVVRALERAGVGSADEAD